MKNEYIKLTYKFLFMTAWLNTKWVQNFIIFAHKFITRKVDRIQQFTFVVEAYSLNFWGNKACHYATDSTLAFLNAFIQHFDLF